MDTTVITIPVPKKGIGCQQLLGMEGVIHHGVLRKRTMANKITDSVAKSLINSPTQLIQWPRRYVVLMEGCVYMYKEETSKKPAYAVSLYGYNSVYPCIGEVQTKLPWPFKVNHALNDKELTLFFSAPTEKDMNIWLEHITQQLVFANGFNASGGQPGYISPPRTLTSGYSLYEGWSSKASTSSGGSGGSVGDWRTGGTSSLESPGGRKVFGEDELVYMSDDEDEFGSNYDEIEEHGLANAFSNASLNSSKGSGNSGVSPGSLSPPTGGPSATTVKPPKPARQLPPLATKPSVNKKPVPIPARPPCPATGGDLGYFNSNEGIEEVDYGTGGEYLEMETIQEILQPEKGIESAFWRRGADEADNTMKQITLIGTYMIRASQDPGSQTLLVKGNQIVRKYKIRRSNQDGKYILQANAPRFETVTALVEYYKSNDLPQNGGPLTRPYSTVCKNK